MFESKQTKAGPATVPVLPLWAGPADTTAPPPRREPLITLLRRCLLETSGRCCAAAASRKYPAAAMNYFPIFFRFSPQKSHFPKTPLLFPTEHFKF